MRRRALFARALASGYAAIGANAVYTLLSVPLALAFLPKAEFGLWALVAQVTGYLALIDCGLSGSISRILIDHKDTKSTGAYGAVLQNGALVTLLQGLAAAVIGYSGAPWFASLAHVPENLHGTFVDLLRWQCGIFGAGLAVKILAHVLTAHQRQEVLNYAQSLSFLGMYAVQWWGFRAGQGVFSLVWASVAGFTIVTLVTAAAALRAEFLPRPGAWGRPDWAGFRSIFAFGAELFLQVLGWQLLAASQLILISRFLGLEAAAVYAVCSKLFMFAQQAVWKVFDFAVAPLSEMAARGEVEKLRTRFGDLVVLSGSLSVVIAAMIAAVNPAFVEVWTKGQMHWPPGHDWLLAGVFIAYTLNRVHGGLAWVAKNVRRIRYVYFVEGLAFIALAAWATPIWGIAGTLVVSITIDFLISGTWGTWHSAHLLGLHPAELLGRWVRPVLMLTLGFGVVAWGASQACQGWPPWPRLLMLTGTLGIAGALAGWFLGLTAALRAEFKAVLGWSKPAPKAACHP
jgi:O-antigen/teichoic acid export membrane protein